MEVKLCDILFFFKLLTNTRKFFRYMYTVKNRLFEQTW